MEDILVPIFVCVVLPVAIVLIVFLAAMNSDNKRAAVIIKAIEVSGGADIDKLSETLRKQKKSPREILNLRLLRGCIFTLIGLSVIIVGIANLIAGSIFRSDQVTVPLMIGAPCLAVGISYLIVYFVSRKQLPEHDRE